MAYDPIVLALVGGIPTALIATIAAYVAWRQWSTAQAKLKLDLFEKRYELFELLWTFVSSRTGAEDLDSAKAKNVAARFSNAQHKFDFLFDEASKVYVKELMSRSIKQDMAHFIANSPPTVPARVQAAGLEYVEHSQWFSQQVDLIGPKFRRFIHSPEWNDDGWGIRRLWRSAVAHAAACHRWVFTGEWRR